MKQRFYLFYTFSFLTLSVSFGQIAGKRINDPVTIGEYNLKPGDTLNLGRGSMNGGVFAYIEQPANVLAGVRQSNFDTRYSGKFVIIKFFKNQKDNYSGQKLFAIVNPFGGFNFMVDLLPAIEVGEVVAINGKKVGKAVPVQAAATTSIADELLKLKQLLDAGAITQAEYDDQKKETTQQVKPASQIPYTY